MSFSTAADRLLVRDSSREKRWAQNLFPEGEVAGSPGKWVAQEEQAGLARKVAHLIPLGVVKG